MATKITKNPATKVEAPATKPATKPATPVKAEAVESTGNKLMYRARFSSKAGCKKTSFFLHDFLAENRAEAFKLAKALWEEEMTDDWDEFESMDVIMILSKKVTYTIAHKVTLKEFKTFGGMINMTKSPATKVEPATQPATKVEPAKTPVVTEAKVSMRVVKGSSWDDLKDCPMWVNHKDSKSSVGQFIIEFFSDKDFTGEELAQAFMNQFKTKTGIKPDEKWARRNVKLFVDKGVIMCEIEPEQDAKD